MNVELLQIGDEDLAGRYRSLVTLTREYTYSNLGDNANRAGVDMSNYLRYVRYSFRQFIAGEPLLAHTAPPFLKRQNDNSSWSPEDIPQDWNDI